MLLSFYSLFFWIGHFILQGTTSIEIISLFDIFLFSLIIFIAFKYLLPAHWEKIPLELNEQGIVDSVRKRTIHWDMIQNVWLVRLYGVITSAIAFDLTNKNHFLAGRPVLQKMLHRLIDYSYRTPIVIPLQYVAVTVCRFSNQWEGFLFDGKTALNRRFAASPQPAGFAD